MGLPVRIAGNAREFARQIDRVLSGEIDREALAESVREYDWSNIIDRLEAIVSEVQREASQSM
jgi:glycosyltransferase involved in cell wall biosynthesis